jgi:hypothetical protein
LLLNVKVKNLLLNVKVKNLLLNVKVKNLPDFFSISRKSDFDKISGSQPPLAPQEACASSLVFAGETLTLVKQDP